MLQAPHWVHEDILQSTAQAWLLQFSTAERGGHWTPYASGAASTVRVRDLRPPPQAEVHLVQADQPETLQSAGHASVLHGTVSASDGHCEPLLAAS